MHLTFGRKIAAGFAAAFLILVVGALSMWSARQALDAARMEAHSQEVIATSEELLRGLLDVETGTRGYLLTGDPRYLEPFDRGLASVPDHLAEMRQLTADNVRQQRRVDSLTPSIDAKLRVSRLIIEGRRSNVLASAAGITRLDSSKTVMDDIRRRIASMQQEERRLLTARIAMRDSRDRAVMWVTALGSLIAFLLVALMIHIIDQDVSLQQRTAAERDRLLVRERSLREQLSAIQRVTDAALAPMGLDELLTELSRRLCEVLVVDAACVLLVMRDGINLEVCKCVGVTEEIVDRVKVPIGQGLEGAIAARQTPIAVRDLRTEQVYDPVVREHFVSLLGVPLIMRDPEKGDRVIGVLHVETVAPRQFTDSELELLVLVADRAASAIERSRLQQAERRAEEQFRALVEGVQDYAIYTLDPEGRVESWNAGSARLKGYNTEEIVGRPADIMYTEEERAAGIPERERQEALEGGRSLRQGWRMRKDGSRFWAEIATTALRDPKSGDLLGFAHVTRDLTELRAADQTLIAARDAAEAANQAKTQFLATMSHEIRTPINAIMGYVELLELELDGPLTPPQTARLGRVRSSARHLLSLVNEVLDLSKIEAQQLDVERIRGSVGDAVSSTIALVFPQASARGIAISNRCAGESDSSYIGDPHRVGQILTNLVSNSVKFTPEGGRITIECGHTQQPDRSSRLHDRETWCFVRVHDTGIGIASEQLESVFDPFVQAPEVTANGRIYTRQHGGTGLGLTISRRLARLMGGDVTAISTLGEGSTFTLWLPAPVEVRGDGAAAAEQTPDDQAAATEPAPGLALAGDTLRLNVEELMRRHTQRLRDELNAPAMAEMTDEDIEDHVGTLVADLARTLVLVQKPEDSARLLRDGSEIQRAIAERHGAQRASYGWTEPLFHRELAILGEDIDALLRSKLGRQPEADVDAAMTVLSRWLDRADQAGIRGFRRASAAARA